MELLNKVSTADLQKLNQSLNTINLSLSNGNYKLQKNIFTLFESLKKDLINSGIYYNLLNPALDNLDKINDALIIGNKFLDNKKTFEETIKLFKNALKSKEDYDANIMFTEGETFGNKAKEHKTFFKTIWWLLFSIIFGAISFIIVAILILLLGDKILSITLGGALFKISVILTPTYLSFYCLKQFSNHRKLYEFYKQKETSVATLSNLYRTYPNNKDLIMEKALNIIFSEMSDKGEIKNNSNEDLISLIKAFIAKDRTS